MVCSSFCSHLSDYLILHPPTSPAILYPLPACGAGGERELQLGRESRSSISRKFCTAAPDAPLPRLSRRATSTAWRRGSLAQTYRSSRSVPLSASGSILSALLLIATATCSEPS